MMISQYFTAAPYPTAARRSLCLIFQSVQMREIGLSESHHNLEKLPIAAHRSWVCCSQVKTTRVDEQPQQA